MSLFEFGFYSLLFIAVSLICIEWAKYGFLEMGLQGPKNKKVLIGVLIGLILSIISSEVYKRTGFIPRLKFIIAIDLWPFLFIPFIRKNMPAGQFQFNKAKERIQYWTTINYMPGEVLENGNRLQDFPRATDTLSLLEQAISAQEDIDNQKSRLNTAIAYGEQGFLYRMMNLLEEAENALKNSMLILERLRREDSSNNEIKVAFSLINFRLAEIYHVTGRLEEAEEGYKKSLSIDKEVGDEKGEEITSLLLAKLQK